LCATRGNSPLVTNEREKFIVPLVTVKVFEDRLDDAAFSAQLTTALTEAVVEVCGESARENTWVVIEGIPRKQWSFGGKLKLL
jgi:4-oxalocrotonate tautomerase